MKISVVTVAYNAEATIADTLASVRAQAGVDYEHIVIDGGSRDATMAIVAAHDHPRLRWISEPDDGLYDAMNKGVALATGAYVGFLNADDFFCRTDALARIVDAARRHRPDAVAAGIAIVRGDAPDRIVRGYRAAGFAPWMLRFGHMPPHPGFYAGREVFARIGGFDTGLRIGADFDWLLRFFHTHRLHAALQSTTVVALRTGGISTRGLASARTINREAALVARRHGLTTHEAVMWTKYAAKMLQYLRRPADFPAPRAVAWAPTGT